VYVNCASLSLSRCSTYGQQTCMLILLRILGSIRRVPSIMQASLLVSMGRIQARLRSELFGLYQFQALISSSLSFSALFLFDYSRYSPLLHSYSRLPAADPVATYRVEQSHSLLRGTEGFGKTRLSDRTASLCYRRKISRDSRMTFTPQREN